jgi:hypothetical protein
MRSIVTWQPGHTLNPIMVELLLVNLFNYVSEQGGKLYNKISFSRNLYAC